LTDLYLLSTSPNSTPITLSSTTTTGGITDAFTIDGSRTLFGKNLVAVSGGFIGDFDALSLVGPATVTRIASNNWQAYATSGSKVVYNDTYDPGPSGLGTPTADIHVEDLSTAGGPTTLVSQAAANFYITSDRTTVVYSWNECADDTAGVYALEVP
jgi:hypothetical protein